MGERGNHLCLAQKHTGNILCILSTAFTLAFNILNFAGIFYWLFKTSTYQEISAAMEQSGLNHKAAYIFLSTFKMIDVMRMNVYTIS